MDPDVPKDEVVTEEVEELWVHRRELAKENEDLLMQVEDLKAQLEQKDLQIGEHLSQIDDLTSRTAIAEANFNGAAKALTASETRTAFSTTKARQWRNEVNALKIENRSLLDQIKTVANYVIFGRPGRGPRVDDIDERV